MALPNVDQAPLSQSMPSSPLSPSSPMSQVPLPKSYASVSASGFSSSSAPPRRQPNPSGRNQPRPSNPPPSAPHPHPQAPNPPKNSSRAPSRSRIDSFNPKAQEIIALESLVPSLRSDIERTSSSFLTNMSTKSRSNPCQRPPIVLCVDPNAKANNSPSIKTIELLSSEHFPSSIFDPLKCHWRANSFEIYLLDDSLHLINDLYSFLLNNRLHLLNSLGASYLRVLRFDGWSVTIRVGGFPHHVPDNFLIDLLVNEWGISASDLVCPPFRPLKNFSDLGADESSVSDFALIELRSIPPKLQLLSMSGHSSFEAFGGTVHWGWDLPPAHLQVKCLLCTHPHHWRSCGLPRAYPEIIDSALFKSISAAEISSFSHLKIERKPNPAAWISSVPQPNLPPSTIPSTSPDPPVPTTLSREPPILIPIPSPTIPPPSTPRVERTPKRARMLTETPPPSSPTIRPTSPPLSNGHQLPLSFSSDPQPTPNPSSSSLGSVARFIEPRTNHRSHNHLQPPHPSINQRQNSILDFFPNPNQSPNQSNSDDTSRMEVDSSLPPNSPI